MEGHTLSACIGAAAASSELPVLLAAPTVVTQPYPIHEPYTPQAWLL